MRSGCTAGERREMLGHEKLVLLEALDQLHGVDGLGDEFELIALAVAFVQDLGYARLTGEEQD